MDNSLLDVSADFISETPKKKPMSPKSFAKDVVERLAIVTPSGRVDAAEFLSFFVTELSTRWLVSNKSPTVERSATNKSPSREISYKQITL